MKKTSLALLTLLLACSGEALDVGGDQDPSPGSGGSGGAQEAAAVRPLPSWTGVGTCPTTGDDAPQFVGTWEGALEDYDLNPITPLRLVITKATSDGVCGTLSWGTDSPAPIPLTEPEQKGEMWGIGGSTAALVEGLTYTISRGAARDTTLRFGAAAYEHWQGFCEMQTDPEYFPGAQAYLCMPQYTTIHFEIGDDECTLGLAGGGHQTLPIKQCAGCDFNVCMCNAEACVADPERTNDFDLLLEQSIDGKDLLVSSMKELGLHAVHLERVE
jgi:hypothetical protein